MRRPIHLVIPCVFLSGCFGTGEGVEVPQDQIYFPVGVALTRDVDPDPGPDHLVVVSSDFDLQYDGGAVQSYDLSSLVQAIPRRCVEQADCEGAPAGSFCQSGGMCAKSEDASPCPNGKERSDADRLLFPGRCAPMTLKSASSTKIGAFATDAIIRERPADVTSSEFPQRLFVPVRGDSTLHWIDVDDDGALYCGQGSDGACNDQHRVGDKASENPRGITLNPEPFALDADARGDTIVVTNQTSGTAALFTNDAWDANGPQLAFELPFNAALRPMGIAAVPQTQAAISAAIAEKRPAPSDTFMMTFRNSAQVRVFSYAPDSTNVANDPRPFLVDAGNVNIDANSVGSDSRGIAIDDSALRAAERRCAGDSECLQAAALVPLDVYVANRSPSSLLIGRTSPPYQFPAFYQTVPLTTGPSRVVVGQVKTPGAEQATETRVFVACFESRRVFVYDPRRARIETEILTGRGPHALAVDTERGLLFVGHFTDSYVGVYSLDLASPGTYGTMLGTLGQPKEPRASK